MSTHSRASTVLTLVATLLLPGCVGHQQYFQEPSAYIEESSRPEGGAVGTALAIIEFDDHGVFWDIRQLDATIALIERFNAEAERGVLVIPYIHGWKNNADPSEEEGDLAGFREEIASIAARIEVSPGSNPDRIIGVFIAWRGATSRIPVHKQLTFWDRRKAAERVASLNMREALFRIMTTTNAHPGSKCHIVGHSMGGLIVGKTLSPSLITLLLTYGDQGVRLPAAMVLLLNPALEALASWQFIDYLKRTNARLELRSPSGEVFEAPGPVMVSITSEVDKATSTAFPLGRRIETMFSAFRDDHPEGVPSQRYLSTHAEGHEEHLVSHRAWVEHGEVVIERVPDAYNTTPFWVIRVSSEISSGHSDTRNPYLGSLVNRLTNLNRVYESELQVWIKTDPAQISEDP